jgi:hypothetical protein
MDVWASEWSGFDTSAPLLGHNELWSNPGTGTADSAVSGTATVSTTGAAVVGFDHDVNGRSHTNPGDEGTGFTALANAYGGNGIGMPEHKRVTTGGTYQATFDDPAFDQHLVVMAIFAEILTAVISKPTPNGTLLTSTTATVGCTTDTSNGTLYAVIDTAANISGVTAAQIKAGQKNNSTAAAFSNNAAVSNTSPSIGFTGLTPATSYSYAIVQNVTAGDSNVLTGSFTTIVNIPLSWFKA